MKAAYFQQHGGSEVMVYGDQPDPQPRSGEVLVRIHVAAMNRVDKWIRDGWPGLKLALPHIPGSDGAGIVESSGSSFQKGDRVVINGNTGCGECEFCLAGQDNLCASWHLLGETTSGTYAELVAVPERQLLRIPDSVSFETAAASALVCLTAWHSMITKGNLRPGETVLVIGAGGGVNTAAIQIAKLAGCTAYVVGSNEIKLAGAQALGADVLIDRSKEDWVKKIFQLTAKRGVDVVVDNVGAATMMGSFRAVRRGGRILTVGNTSGPTFEIDNRFIFGKQISILGSTMGTIRDFAAVMKIVFDGRIKIPIDAILPLSEVRQAHEKMEKGDYFGKILLMP
ncbi:zinc-binding dehydrogenase [bacterium]|nr:zinc-binding dehydrogenase [bacterium]MCI0606436.1 zinc-binding dehydrogenase [bacterium]